MDELGEEDKLVVGRARRIQFFLSQNFHVAEQFTGQKGSYVPVAETIKGFSDILEGSTTTFQKMHSDLLDASKKLSKKRKYGCRSLI